MPVQLSAKWRVAMPTLAVVRLKRVVVSAVRTVLVIAPLDMRASAAIVVVVDRTGDQGAGDECAGRKPEAIVLTLVPALGAVATVAVVVSGIAVPTEVVAVPVVPSPVLAPLPVVLDLDDVGLDACSRRHENGGCGHRNAGERESYGQAACAEA